MSIKDCPWQPCCICKKWVTNQDLSTSESRKAMLKTFDKWYLHKSENDMLDENWHLYIVTLYFKGEFS